VRLRVPRALDRPSLTPPASYANSIIQALYFCAPFRELLISTPDPAVPSQPAPVPASSSSSALHPAAQPQPPTVKRRPTYRAGEPEPAPVAGTVPIPGAPPTLFSALRSLFVHIATHPADKGTVAPRAFVDRLKAANEGFRGTGQQDAHEFFNFALNLVADEIRRNRRDAGLRECGRPAGNGRC
jgi:ubiquitin carboxyl-terminal hydrolase 9/13